jgi:hypothetical protein
VRREVCKEERVDDGIAFCAIIVVIRISRRIRRYRISAGGIIEDSVDLNEF